MVQTGGQMALLSHQGTAHEEGPAECWDAYRIGE